MKNEHKAAIAAPTGMCALGLSQATLHRSTPSAHSKHAGTERSVNWSMIGGGPGNSHYSSLKQINRSNVAKLRVAWNFNTGEPGGLETTPIVVDGVLYTLTPSQEVIALDAATGRLLWKFDSGTKGPGPDH